MLYMLFFNYKFQLNIKPIIAAGRGLPKQGQRARYRRQAPFRSIFCQQAVNRLPRGPGHQARVHVPTLRQTLSVGNENDI